VSYAADVDSPRLEALPGHGGRFTPKLTGPWCCKRGALWPPYRATLRRADRRALDLSGASVEFVMRRRGDTDPWVQAPAEVLDAERGVVRYSWEQGDTALPGIFNAEFLISDDEGLIARVPSDGYLSVHILGNLSEPYEPDELSA